MKTLQSILLATVTLLFILASCGGGKVKPIEGMSRGQLDSASYAFGVHMGSLMKNSGLGTLNTDQILKGYNDFLGDKQKFGDEEIYSILNDYIMFKNIAEGENNLKEGEKFLAENKNKQGVVTLESGLQYKIIQEGTGIFPTEEDTVEVYYKGTYIDGEVFDSTDLQGSSATFPLNGVIRGWTEGIQLINEGGKIMLYIPTDLAYGTNYPYIRPNATLIFEVELLQVIKSTEPEWE